MVALRHRQFARAANAGISFAVLWVFFHFSQLLFAAPPAGYYLVWADEFNGASLDSKYWNMETGARRDAINTASAVSLNGSNLVITTYTTNNTHYTALVETSGKFNPRYGYSEASIKWGDSSGMWSAFWMWIGTMTTVGDVSVNGAELDVCEHRLLDGNNGNASINNIVQSNFHWDGYGTDHKSVGSGNIGSGLGSGYHTYALRWDSSQYRVLIDDVQKYSTTSANSDRSEYFIFSSEVDDTSTTWAGTIPVGGYGNLGASTTKMSVDYLRFYAPTSTVYWDGSASADWTNSANWVAGMTPQSGNDVVFSYLSTSNRATVLNQNLTLNSLAFLETAGAVSITNSTLILGAGGIDIVSAVNDPVIYSPIVLNAAQTWKSRSGRTLIINGPISGSPNLTLDGYGSVRLAASNSLTGKIIVAGGDLVITNENQLGPNPVSFTADQLTLDGGRLRSGESGSLAAVTLNDANRGITLAAGGGTFRTFFNTSFTVSNSIAGPGALTKDSVGTLNLAAANTVSGDTRIVGGTLVLLHANALQNSTVDMNTNDAGALNLNNLNVRLGGLAGGRDVGLGSGAVTIGGNGSNTVYSGSLSGNGTLTKIGGGSWTLSGSNSFSGPLLVSAGYLVIGSSNALGTASGNTVVANGAEVRCATSGLNIPESFTLAGATNALHSTGGAGGAITFSGAITLGGSSSIKVDGSAPTLNLNGNFSLGANTLTVSLDGAGTSVIGGIVSGTGALTKSSTGTLRLDNANTFSGDTRIISGVLAVNHTNALQNSTIDLNTADAGTLNLNNLNARLGGLNGSRNLALGYGNISIGNNNQTTEFSGSLTGAGSLAKIGSGTLTLSGSNNISGSVTVSGGILNLTNFTASSAVIVNAGATLGGNGIVTGSVIVQTGGAIAPGNSIGTLTISNALSLAGITMMELNTSAATNDLIRGLTSVTFGGTLALTNLNGSLAANDSFKLFDAASYGGAFTNYTPASPGPGLAWDASSLVSNGMLRVVAVVSPQFSGITHSGVNNFLITATGTPGQSHSIYWTTNLALPFVQWPLLDTTWANGGGIISFTDAQATNSQRYYRLTIP